MPTYDYRCKKGHVWEETRAVVERNEPARCPECGDAGRRAYVNAPGLPWYPDSTREPYREKRKV